MMDRTELEIEECVIGAMLLDNTSEVKSSIAFLKPEYFGDQKHKIIFRAVQVLCEAGEAVDILTVTRFLREKKQIDRVGGPLAISKLTNKIASTAHLESHSRIVFQNHMTREIGRMGVEMMRVSTDPAVDPFDVLSTAEKMITSLRDGIYSGSDNIKSVAQILPQINQTIERRLKDELIGLPTGFSELDEVLYGWVKTDLIYVGGRPGMGKTSFLLSVSIILAEMGIPSVFFSLEMSAEQLVGRLISQIIEVPYQDIMLRRCDEYVLQRFHEMMGRIERLPIYIDDTPALTISEVRRRAKKAVEKHGVKLVLLDYAQLVRGTDTKSKNREQEVSEVSRGLKQCAKENSVPVIAGAQLGRKQNEKEKPTLKDFRESGSFEQDADVVIFPYRAEYYGVMEDEKGESTQGKVEMIIAKHRNGGLGNPTMNFVARLAKFQSAKYHSQQSLPHPDSRIESKVRQNDGFLNSKPQDEIPF